MGRQNAERVEVNANGKVEITADEYREYQGFLRGRDKSLEAVRTQARIDRAEALKLARAVSSGLIGYTKTGVAIVNNPAAANALELANDLLATE